MNMQYYYQYEYTYSYYNVEARESWRSRPLGQRAKAIGKNNEYECWYSY